MNVIAKRVTCGCGEKYDSDILPPASYGEFLLRSEDGKIVRYLDAASDAEYQELAEMIRRHPRFRGETDRVRSDVLQHVFGLTCDPLKAGLRIGLDPPCPTCGRHDVVEWYIPEPLVIRSVEIPEVTHLAWERLTDTEREARLERALASI